MATREEQLRALDIVFKIRSGISVRTDPRSPIGAEVNRLLQISIDRARSLKEQLQRGLLEDKAKSRAEALALVEADRQLKIAQEAEARGEIARRQAIVPKTAPISRIEQQLVVTAPPKPTGIFGGQIAQIREERSILETKARRGDITIKERASLFAGGIIGFGLEVPGRFIGFGRGLLTEPVKTITKIPMGFIEFGKEVGTGLRSPTPETALASLTGEALLFKGSGKVIGAGVKVVKRGAKAPPLFPQETGLPKLEFPKRPFEPVSAKISERILELDFQRPSGFDIFPREPFIKSSKKPITPFRKTFPEEFVTETIIAGRKPRPITFEIIKEPVTRFDIIETVKPKTKPTPLKPITFEIIKEQVTRFDTIEAPKPKAKPKTPKPITFEIIKEPVTRFDTLDIKPPKVEPAFFVFEKVKTKPFAFLEEPKPPKAPKRKRARVTKTISDFETKLPIEKDIVRQRGRQQQLIQVQKPLEQIQKVKLKDAFDIRQIQRQRFEEIGGLQQTQFQIPRSRFKFDARSLSLLRQPQEFRQRELDVFATKFKQVQKFKFKQPQRQAFAALDLILSRERSAISPRQKEKALFSPKLDLLSPEFTSPILREPQRGKKKKIKGKPREKASAIIRPSFTAIILGIKTPAQISKLIGVSPLTIRGLQTNFTFIPPREPRKKKRK